MALLEGRHGRDDRASLERGVSEGSQEWLVVEGVQLEIFERAGTEWNLFILPSGGREGGRGREREREGEGGRGREREGGR